MGSRSNDRTGKQAGRRLRVTPAMAIAGLALFIALGGTSIAASGLINGKKIKPGTVTAKQIKNKTITTAKLAPATVKGLRGKTGPKGETGPAGEPGVKGEPGPASLPAAFQDETYGVEFESEFSAPVAELEVPAGRYIVTGKVELNTDQPADTSCWIAFDHDDYLDSARWRSPGDSGWGTISLLGISPAGTETLTLSCFAEHSGAIGRSKIVAIPVAG